jgi:uncharacterized protein (TIGR02246 family)
MRIPALLWSLALAACVSVPAPPDDVRGVIERKNADAVRWYAAGDVESLASLFATDAWQMPPNSAPLVGRDAIRDFWAQAVRWGKWNFALQTEEVSMSGPIAIERGKYVLRFTAGPAAPPGMSSFEDRGNYLVHWRRDADGEWRVAADAPVSQVQLPGR